jgi:hypothetical protein
MRNIEIEQLLPEYEIIMETYGEEDCLLKFNLDTKNIVYKPKLLLKKFETCFRIVLKRLKLSGKYFNRLCYFIRVEKSQNNRYHCHGVMFGSELTDNINLIQFKKEFNKVWKKTLGLSNTEYLACENYKYLKMDGKSFLKYALKSKETKDTIPIVLFSKALKESITNRKKKSIIKYGGHVFETGKWGFKRVFSLIYDGYYDKYGY